MATFELMPGDVALGQVGDTLKTLLGVVCERDPDRSAPHGGE
jgi:hypothetical protein